MQFCADLTISNIRTTTGFYKTIRGVKNKIKKLICLNGKLQEGVIYSFSGPDERRYSKEHYKTIENLTGHKPFYEYWG